MWATYTPYTLACVQYMAVEGGVVENFGKKKNLLKYWGKNIDPIFHQKKILKKKKFTQFSLKVNSWKIIIHPEIDKKKSFHLEIGRKIFFRVIHYRKMAAMLVAI